MRPQTPQDSHRPVTTSLSQPAQVARLGAAEAARQQALLQVAGRKEAVRPERRLGDRRSA